MPNGSKSRMNYVVNNFFGFDPEKRSSSVCNLVRYWIAMLFQFFYSNFILHAIRIIRNENGTSPIFKILKNRLSLFLKWLAHFLKPKKRIYISDTKSRNCLMYYSFIIYFVNVWSYKLANFLAIAHFVIVFLHINNNNNKKTSRNN